jgi:hypothetical protein
MRLLGELDALFPEIGRNCVDARNRKAEMVEALIGVTGPDSRRRRIDLGRKDHGAAEPDIDTRLALLRRTDHSAPNMRSNHCAVASGSGVRR